MSDALARLRALWDRDEDRGYEAWMLAPGDYAALLAVAEAAARVSAWMAQDCYTQLEKVDGGFDLVAALAALEEVKVDE